MRSLLIIMLMSAISAAYAKNIEDLYVSPREVIQIETVSVLPDGSFGTVSGTITGVVTAPKGDYKVKITNGKSFKGESFSKMTCNILPLDEIKYVKGESIPLATAFNVDGKLYNVMGFYTGTDIFPVSGYEIIVKNGRSRLEWNSMNCIIK